MAHGSYFLPHKATQPILGSLGLFVLLFGFSVHLNGGEVGATMMVIGAAVIVLMMVLWFGEIIHESVSGLYNEQVDTSFKMGMIWFIMSEVFFFAAFFGALYLSLIHI